MGILGQFIGYVVFFTCAMVGFHVVRKSSGSEEPRPGRERFPVIAKQVIWGWLVGLAIGLALIITGAFVLFLVSLFQVSVLLGLIALAVVFFGAREWLREWLFLMDLDDDHLPGRFDKPIWAALLVVLPPVGVWTFRLYRRQHWPEAASKPAPVAEIS